MFDEDSGTMSPTAYDRVPYRGNPYVQTHPARLAAIARLFDVSPASPERCRVLEIACGDGANLIPMACSMPRSEFVGFDISQTAIDTGKNLAQELKLENLSLSPVDLREFPVDAGAFDYIIAHGLYSWIPDALRDNLLALVARHLAPQGVAFVSYNTLPGCHIRRMMWEMLRFHVEPIHDPGQRVAEARALLGLLAHGQATPDAYGQLVRVEAEQMLERDASYLLHDDLAEINDPVYFHQFLERAERHGLQYLAEAELGAMSAVGLDPRLRSVLDALDPVLREQYLDFARGRRFRQTLLCRGEVSVDRCPTPERLDSLLIGHGTRTKSRDGDSIDQRAANTLLSELARHHPLHVAGEDLVQCAHAQFDAPTERPSREHWHKVLLALVRAGAVEIRATAPRLSVMPGPRPTASALARAQNARGTVVTNLLHESVRLDDELARALLALLDGTRDRRQLRDELDHVLHDTHDPERVIDEHLRHFGRLALLMEDCADHSSSIVVGASAPLRQVS